MKNPITVISLSVLTVLAIASPLANFERLEVKPVPYGQPKLTVTQNHGQQLTVNANYLQPATYNLQPATAVIQPATACLQNCD